MYSLQKSLYKLLEPRINFLEKLYISDDKDKLIKYFQRNLGIEGRIKGERLEKFFSSRINSGDAKIFTNFMFECEGKKFEYDIVLIYPGNICDYFEVKSNPGDVNYLMNDLDFYDKPKVPRDLEMKSLLGKKKTVIRANSLSGVNVPMEFEFRDMYFITLDREILCPTRLKEIFFGVLVNKVRKNVLVTRNYRRDNFYFKGNGSIWNFTYKIFKNFITKVNDNYFLINEYHLSLEEVDNYFGDLKSDYEKEFNEKFCGIKVLKSVRV